jgi:hypothetical protein
MVYFPALTPSNFSNSAWSTHCRQQAISLLLLLQDTRHEANTYLAWEINLNGLDADVLGARHGVGGVVCTEREKDNKKRNQVFAMLLTFFFAGRTTVYTGHRSQKTARRQE